MYSSSWQTKFQRKIQKKVYQLLPTDKILKRPVFIVGCGRSGTTILGKMLSQHSEIAYFNEPRDIWLCATQTDIWTRKAQVRSGKLKLTAADLTPEIASRIKNEFAVRIRLKNGSRLVEKLPINSFRIGFLNALFPDALFIHLLRNGLEVAQSIATLAETKPWFGRKDYKWNLLKDYAVARGDGELVELSTNNFLKGILEWRLSVESSREGLSNLASDRWIEIRYEDLLENAIAVCTTLEQFIGLEPSQEMRQFAATQINRKSPRISQNSLSPAIEQIAGELLTRLNYTYGKEELLK
ncbi:MAG: sulfotransferase [Oscillatoria sp. PMC 1068.18]|nr:sulfotransferase [Oscillatoria sp. PMC 1076.18]MEC4991611.1 sulfotransferase [Oscillatoria sp. PMC 1068.18]